MHEIKCPNCGAVIQIEESAYAELLRQVRDEAFREELDARIAQMAESAEAKSALSAADAQRVFQETLSRAELEHSKALAEKDREYDKAIALTEQKLADAISKKDQEIAELKAKLSSADMDKELAVNKAVSEKDRLLAETAAEKDRLLLETAAEKDRTIAAKSLEISELANRIETQKQAGELKEKTLKDSYEERLRAKEEEVAYYRDLKARQSTKMVGETLEQHCEIEFNRLRATGFKNAYFEKDSDVKTGTKGDYIYRDYSDDGTEFISIMFEMKNEMDETASKHRNEDFFKKLDKDRCDKGCEYAVLVSLLESDSELYNTGIVDVSHRYPKMYVIRPQFFIPMITMLRNAALNSLEYQQELALVKAQNIDITNFEADMNEFKEKFGRNYRLASEKFRTAIEEIDKSIDHLQRIKNALTGAENNLRLANDKAEDLSIKKLTKNNPTMRAKFEALETAGADPQR